jgi:alpha,alpha-trehalase
VGYYVNARSVSSRTTDHRSAPPLALEHLSEIERQLQGKQPAVFVDYDGTLTPIVSRPDLAQLSEKSRETLRRLAQLSVVAIVSGRDLVDVQKLVSLDTLVYAGSHGFDIRGPDGLAMQHASGPQYLPLLARAAEELDARIGAIEGVLIERKGFAVATHFRLVADRDLDAVRAGVQHVAGQHPGLRITRGKKVVELRPDIEWDKGTAVRWLLRTLGLHHAAVLPMFIGDDLTDEDAFVALEPNGLSFLVCNVAEVRTHAKFLLRDTDEVRHFLSFLVRLLEGRQ